MTKVNGDLLLRGSPSKAGGKREKRVFEKDREKTTGTVKESNPRRSP